MNIIDHGTWTPYTPEKAPEGLPPNIVFVKRAGDGVDWYRHVNAEGSFRKDSVALTLFDNVVRVATRDPTTLWPAGARVLELTDMAVADPQAMFGGKTYDQGARTFVDGPTPEPHPLAKWIARLEARIAALEGKS